MKVEKIIENIDIKDYITSVEIIEDNKIKITYEIPDSVLSGSINVQIKQSEKKVYEHEYIPYPRKKTKVQEITGADYSRKPHIYESRTDAAKAIGVNRETLYSRIRKGKGRATIQTLKGTFKITAVEE